MFKRVGICILFLVLLQVGLAFASEGQEAVKAASAFSINFFVATVLGITIGLSIAASVCGFAQGMAISKALEGIARQPEATSKIQLLLMIGLAFIESLVLYVLFVGIVLLFANPFVKYFTQ